MTDQVAGHEIAGHENTGRRRIQVSHPNIFTFLGHLQHVTTECMNDMARLTNGLKIIRPKKKMNLMNETRIRACISRFDSGHYTRLQFLRAVACTQMLCSRARMPTPAMTTTSMTSHQRPRPHHLLQRLPQLQHQRHLQTTAVKSV